MNTMALDAFGLFLAALGATLLYFFAIRRQPVPGFLSEDVHIVRDPLRETFDIHSEMLTVGAQTDAGGPALREAIGFLGYLALVDGFFLQFIAALEAIRAG